MLQALILDPWQTCNPHSLGGPGLTCKSYGFPALTKKLSKMLVCAKWTFSSKNPCSSSKRFGLWKQETNISRQLPSTCQSCHTSYTFLQKHSAEENTCFENSSFTTINCSAWSCLPDLLFPPLNVLPACAHHGQTFHLSVLFLRTVSQLGQHTSLTPAQNHCWFSAQDSPWSWPALH